MSSKRVNRRRRKRKSQAQIAYDLLCPKIKFVKHNYRESILFLYSDASAPLTAILKNIPKP